MNFDPNTAQLEENKFDPNTASLDTNTQDNKLIDIRQKFENTPQGRQSLIVALQLAKNPIGRIALRSVGISNNEIDNTLKQLDIKPKTTPEKISQAVTSAGTSYISTIPVLKLIRGLLVVSKFPELAKFVTGMGLYGGTEKAIEGKPQEVIPGSISSASSALFTAGLMKGGASIVPKQIPGAERIGSTIGGVVAGGLSGGTEDAMLMGALGAAMPQQRATFKRIGISKIRDYAANKTNSIRPGLRQYWKREVKAYGDAIDSLSKDNKPIELEPAMESMTKLMIDRKLYDPIAEKWLTPTNKVDRQLLTSYENLSRYWKKSGNAPTSKIIQEYRNIRDSADIETSLGRDARTVSNNLINSIRPQIKSDILDKANARYSDFRTTFDLLDRKIGVWNKPIETARAEKFLTSGELSSTTESRKLAKIIEEQTGESLKGAKLISAINRFPGVKFLLRR